MLPDGCARWVTEAVGPGSRIESVRHLPLGSWHVNHAVDVVEPDGRVRRLVLRRWARAGWERDDPDYTVQREVRVLNLLRGTDIPAPAVVASDPDGERCGVPAILLTRLPGQPPQQADGEAVSFCRQLAETLARLHDFVGAAQSGLDAYRLYYDRTRAVPAPWMPPTSVWWRATAAVRETPPSSAMAFIHRDYHPENTLWSRQRLSGVVDWTQASYGPPGLDLGHMRWNLVLDHGAEVADRFLAFYRAVSADSCDDQPYWDLVSLFDLLLGGLGPGDLTLDDLRTLEEYAGKALSRLA